MSWIGVDLDGTLAQYNSWEGPTAIGAPIPRMVEMVRYWLSHGWDVRIFTARVADDGKPGDMAATVAAIQAWCQTNIGQVLPITNVKDSGMVELWDDRAVSVAPNTGYGIRAEADPFGVGARAQLVAGDYDPREA